MKIGITAIRGHMGTAVAQEAIGNPLFDVTSALVREGYDEVGMDIGKVVGKDSTKTYVTDDLEKFFDEVDAVVDFSSPELTMKCAEMAAKKKKILISGTRGLLEQDMAKLRTYSNSCVIVHSNNMSIGLNLLLNVVEEVASLLHEEYDAEILEMYGRQKMNAPSDTSLSIGKAIARGRGWEFGDVIRRTRDGFLGERGTKEIGFNSVRGGDVVGEHSAIFAAPGEIIEFKHRAFTDLIFVRGALRAAIWSLGRPTGLYNMTDVMAAKG